MAEYTGYGAALALSLILPSDFLESQSLRLSCSGPLDADGYFCPVYKTGPLFFHRPAHFPKTNSKQVPNY